MEYQQCSDPENEPEESDPEIAETNEGKDENVFNIEEEQDTSDRMKDDEEQYSALYEALGRQVIADGGESSEDEEEEQDDDDDDYNDDGSEDDEESENDKTESEEEEVILKAIQMKFKFTRVIVDIVPLMEFHLIFRIILGPTISYCI